MPQTFLIQECLHDLVVSIIQYLNVNMRCCCICTHEIFPNIEGLLKQATQLCQAWYFNHKCITPLFSAPIYWSLYEVLTHHTHTWDSHWSTSRLVGFSSNFNGLFLFFIFIFLLVWFLFYLFTFIFSFLWVERSVRLGLTAIDICMMSHTLVFVIFLISYFSFVCTLLGDI